MLSFVLYFPSLSYLSFCIPLLPHAHSLSPGNNFQPSSPTPLPPRYLFFPSPSFYCCLLFVCHSALPLLWEYDVCFICLVRVREDSGMLCCVRLLSTVSMGSQLPYRAGAAGVCMCVSLWVLWVPGFIICAVVDDDAVLHLVLSLHSQWIVLHWYWSFKIYIYNFWFHTFFLLVKTYLHLHSPQCNLTTDSLVGDSDMDA